MTKQKKSQLRHREQRETLAVEVAKLYYESEMTEEEIGREKHLSRPTVHRMIREAREKGLVSVKVLSTTSAHEIFRLREELKKRFPVLKYVYIAPAHFFYEKPDSINEDEGRNSQKEEVLHDVALLAASVFRSRLRELNQEAEQTGACKTVAVGPGMLTKQTVSEMSPEKLPDLHIVPTNGYLYEQATEFSANEVGALMASKTGATFHWLPCVGIVKTEHVPTIKELPIVGDTLDWIPRSTLVLTGVRDFRAEDLKRYKKFFRPEDIVRYVEAYNRGEIQKPIGLICDHPFTSEGAWDIKGTEQDEGKKERVIGLKLSEMLELANPNTGTGTVICVVASEGAERTEALRAALKIGYFNILVTDARTARELAPP